MPNYQRFATVDSTHYDCALCDKAAESAEVHAAVTGSVGATYTDDRTRVGGTEHSATVRRIPAPFRSYR